ncbi:MAG: hypothetical protein AB9M53_00895 [Leptothrix sp. (in: b-proteobacteria)]
MITIVEEWRQSWRWLTVNLGAALLVLPPAWATLSDEQQAAIIAMLPDVVTQHLAGWQALMALGAAIVALRLIKQGPKQ